LAPRLRYPGRSRTNVGGIRRTSDRTTPASNASEAAAARWSSEFSTNCIPANASMIPSVKEAWRTPKIRLRSW
jgi:hypothetical protein